MEIVRVVPWERYSMPLEKQNEWGIASPPEPGILVTGSGGGVFISDTDLGVIGYTAPPVEEPKEEVFVCHNCGADGRLSAILRDAEGDVHCPECASAEVDVQAVVESGGDDGEGQ